MSPVTFRDVPPTDTFKGEAEGKIGPLTALPSPEAAKNVTFGFAAMAGTNHWFSSYCSYELPSSISSKPQLCETTEAPNIVAAVYDACERSFSELSLASTSSIFASGAIAWDHSTSSAISRNQAVVFRWQVGWFGPPCCTS